MFILNAFIVHFKMYRVQTVSLGARAKWRAMFSPTCRRSMQPATHRRPFQCVCERLEAEPKVSQL